MVPEELILGIDTSNYTTSIALITASGKLVANVKRPLPVKPGERGLRQSDAVFAHIKNIPDAMAEIAEALGGNQPVAVGVSTRPRNVEGSYMPCFLSGVSVAEGISKALGVPLYSFSHQCGHISAAMFSSGVDLSDRSAFGAFHISGGTTELLMVKPKGTAFVCEVVGGTRDLNAGQVIDRIGVRMGLPFPAGKHMEELAKSVIDIPKYKKPSVDGTFANLSGLENLAVNHYLKTGDKSATAAIVFAYIGDAILSMCRAFLTEYGEMPIVFAGGVMSNSLIKTKLSNNLSGYFSEPSLSADNAVGIAELARKSYLNK